MPKSPFSSTISVSFYSVRLRGRPKNLFNRKRPRRMNRNAKGLKKSELIQGVFESSIGTIAYKIRGRRYKLDRIKDKGASLLSNQRLLPEVQIV